MLPLIVVAPPPVDEAKKKEQRPTAPTREGAASAAGAAVRGQYDFLAEVLLDSSKTRPKRPVWQMLVSVVLQSFLLTALLMIPLFYTEAIDLKAFTQTFLVAPPPPPPPPPPAAPIVVEKRAPRPTFVHSGRLVAPTVIPEKVAMIREEPMDMSALGAGVVGGVPGGMPGGQIGGVIGGIITGAPKTYVPAPVAAPRAPVRVGGRVMAPRVLSAPEPLYPPLAKQARVSGDVQVDAVIDTHGNVVEMQVVSGHPLLIPAALDALRKWKYQPTILNDEPVAVQLIVTIRFRLQ
jgi:protein TonB